MAELLKRMLVQHRRSSPYYPQANGLVEKNPKVLTSILGKIILEKQREWDLHIGEALWAYRMAHKTVIEFPPFSIGFRLQNSDAY